MCVYSKKVKRKKWRKVGGEVGDCAAEESVGRRMQYKNSTQPFSDLSEINLWNPQPKLA